MFPDDDNPERRTEPRSRSLLAGRLAYGDPQVNVPCTVRNLTPHGATIQIETPTVMTGPLQLLIIAQAIAFDATIIWNKGLKLGLRLGTSHDMRKPTEEARYLQAIWRQTAAR